jgi:prevent-host-death family protein
MTKSIEAREARSGFGDLVENVHYSGQAVIIESSGRPMVAVIPAEMYQQLVARREARPHVLGRVRAWLSELPPDEAA